MDLGLSSVASSERPTKLRAVQSKTDVDAKELQRVVTACIKLSLSNALQIRGLRSVMLDVLMVSSESPYVQDAQQATRIFADQMKEASDKAKREIGLPHVHAWNAVLLEFKKRGTPEEKKAVEKYIAFLKSTEGQLMWECVNREVRFFRITKCYKAEFKKIEINFRPDSASANMWSLIEAKIVKEGAKRMPGTAPPGDLERTLQKWLDGGSE